MAVVEHNHNLSGSYHEKKQWRSHGDIDPTTKAFIKNLRDNNVNLGKVCSILNCDNDFKGPPMYRKGVVKSLCGRLAAEKMKDDIGKTVSLLEELREADPSLSVSLDVDNDGTIKNMMWCTGKNKSDYCHFGDAITFDTTYRTNLYKMPFGLFVGVNNHFQSIVFAGVLMTHETTDAFKWVFSTFARLMGNAEPKTILTYQATAMESALKVTWENTHHRWCRWHVLRNAKSKIGQKYSKFSKFKSKFNWLVSTVMPPETFESEWESIIKKYKLTKNKFLERIFGKRHMWAKPYFLKVFCAGMTSTQRSESANHMLKGHIPRASPMHLFVRKYNNFLQSRESAEETEKHATKQKARSLKIGVPIELHAKSIYTRAMYTKFEEALFDAGSYAIKGSDETNKYIVRHAIRGGREFNVTLNNGQTKIECSCGMMTHFGMLCCHALKVLVHNDALEIPRDNILTRWTVTAGLATSTTERNVASENCGGEQKSFMHDALWLAARKLVEKGKENWSTFDTAMTVLENGGNEVDHIAKKTKLSSLPFTEIISRPSSSTFIEVYQGSNQLRGIPKSLACPERQSATGKPNSSSLKAWKQANKKKTRSKRPDAVHAAIAEVDEASTSLKVKRLAEIESVMKL